jgi:hypothetical protein
MCSSCLCRPHGGGATGPSGLARSSAASWAPGYRRRFTDGPRAVACTPCRARNGVQGSGTDVGARVCAWGKSGARPRWPRGCAQVALPAPSIGTARASASASPGPFVATASSLRRAPGVETDLPRVLYRREGEPVAASKRALASELARTCPSSAEPQGGPPRPSSCRSGGIGASVGRHRPWRSPGASLSP